MKNLSKLMLTAAITLGASMCIQAQTMTHEQQEKNDHREHTYRYTVVSRTTQAVNYKHRSGSTKINFQGTDLMPSATGEAKVDSHRGAMEIKVEFADLQRPEAFGNEYLTYVMWAISPEGRAINLGEVLVGDNHRSKLDVTTDLQTFALIVTAEPYYAVRQPSNVVVMENIVRRDTEGSTEAVEAKYELIGRGGYVPKGYNFDAVVLDSRLPLEFFEARNALRIAQSAGAEDFALPSWTKAVDEMKEADALARRRHENSKELIAISRSTVQTAEDAREIAMKRVETEMANNERNASAGRERDANANAEAERQRRAAAEANANQESKRRAEAEANANLEAQRRASAEGQTAEAIRQREEADRKKSDAEAAARQAREGQMNAEAESDRNRAAAANSEEQLQKAIREREELRANLLKQFNLIMETRDTARGLVVNMSDVLFDSNKYTLRPGAREKLAKISGILLAYPTLRVAVEGNTDSVGTEEYNQELSEKRAESVRSYLTAQGVPAESTTSAGFGKTRPVATNDTAEGRQQNRRVELIVSGEVIGTKIVTLTVTPVAPLPQHK